MKGLLLVVFLIRPFLFFFLDLISNVLFLFIIKVHSNISGKCEV